MFGLGFGELLIIAIVALLVLGPQKLPEAAKMLGKGMRELRKSTRELKDAFDLEVREDPKDAARPGGRGPAADRASAAPEKPAVPPAGVVRDPGAKALRGPNAGPAGAGAPARSGEGGNGLAPVRPGGEARPEGTVAGDASRERPPRP